LRRCVSSRTTDDCTTLTAVIEQALRQYLALPRRAVKSFRLRLLTKRGRLLPGVNIADRDALYERMEGRPKARRGGRATLLTENRDCDRFPGFRTSRL
jgi:hypothetical protein